MRIWLTESLDISKNNDKRFSNICHANSIFKHNILRYSYCNKNNHVSLLCFIRKKTHESKKNAYSTFHFYKEYHENEMRNTLASYYLCDHDYS